MRKLWAYLSCDRRINICFSFYGRLLFPFGGAFYSSRLAINWVWRNDIIKYEIFFIHTPAQRPRAKHIFERVQREFFVLIHHRQRRRMTSCCFQLNFPRKIINFHWYARWINLANSNEFMHRPSSLMLPYLTLQIIYHCDTLDIHSMSSLYHFRPCSLCHVKIAFLFFSICASRATFVLLLINWKCFSSRTTVLNPVIFSLLSFMLMWFSFDILLFHEPKSGKKLNCHIWRAYFFYIQAYAIISICF